jgi:hypothetical protein
LGILYRYAELGDATAPAAAASVARTLRYCYGAKPNQVRGRFSEALDGEDHVGSRYAVDIYYRDHPAMMQSWGWQVETGTHLLRLISSGVFDRYPNLKIIVGHMGELIPFSLKRINNALTMGNWLLASQSKNAETAARSCMQKSLFYYMRANVFITTSGVFDQAALHCAIAELGIDNILFSVDDPFGDNFEGVDFLNKAQLSKEDKEKLAHENAERVLKLSPGTTSRRSSSRSLFSFKAKVKAKIARAILSLLVR